MKTWLQSFLFNVGHNLCRYDMEVALHKKGFIREFEGSWTVTEEPTVGALYKLESS